MKIRRIQAYQVDLPLHEGSYKWSGGKSVSVFDSTVVQIDTDAGHIELRGTEGDRQVPDARTALICAGSSFFHDPAGVVLRT